jgi:hypothetical protein
VTSGQGAALRGTFLLMIFLDFIFEDPGHPGVLRAKEALSRGA